MRIVISIELPLTTQSFNLASISVNLTLTVPFIFIILFVEPVFKMVNCGVCTKVIASNKPKLVCSDCSVEFHGSCLGMSKADIECITVDGLVWRCTTCASTRRKSMRLDSSVEEGKVTLDDLMTAIKEIKEGQKTCEKDYNTSFETLNTKLDENTEAIKNQSLKTDKYFEIIEELMTENKQLKQKIQKLEERIEEVEQYSRNNSLEIQGIPMEQNENVLNIVKEVGKALDLEISDSMVDACHRLGKKKEVEGEDDKPPGIIVKFVRRMDKEEFIRKRRVKRTLSTRHINRPMDQPIYVNESLSPSRRRLLFMAREAKKDKNYQFLWVRNGKIFLRKEEKSAVKTVRNHEDLSKL